MEIWVLLSPYLSPFLNVQDFVCMRVRGMHRACAAACVSLTVRQLDPENPSQGPWHCDPVLRRRNSAHSPQGRARARLCMKLPKR